MWAKFKEGFLEAVSLKNISNILIAVGVVYILAWIVGVSADAVVGWAALGIAAGSKR